MAEEKSLKDIQSSEELQELLSRKGRNHKYYKFYTGKIDVIENILLTHALYLSDGNNCNDLNDKERFNSAESDDRRFGMCMCSTMSENIAMWYMYSGKDGAMIDFSADVIKSCLQAEKINLGHFENNRFVLEKTFDRSQFSLEISDIVYFGDAKKGNGKYLKLRDKGIEVSSDIIQNLHIYKKELPWSYENECRLTVKCRKDLFADYSTIDTVKIEFDEKLAETLKNRIFLRPGSQTKGSYRRSKMDTSVNIVKWPEI